MSIQPSKIMWIHNKQIFVKVTNAPGPIYRRCVRFSDFLEDLGISHYWNGFTYPRT